MGPPPKTIALAASRSFRWIGAVLACLALVPAAAQVDDDAPADAAPGPAVRAEPVDAAAVDEGAAAVDEGGAAAADASAGADAAAAPSVEPADPATLASPLEASIELDRLMRQELFDAALLAGARMVELTEQEFGRNHRETAAAYERLANAQRRAERHDEAEVSYHAAIEIYRNLEGQFTPLAIEPLTSLGDNYQLEGEHLSAVSAYEEARTTTRRAYGLLAPEQGQLLERIAESLLELKRVDEADERQREALRLVERRAEPGSQERVDAMFTYAAWLRRIKRYQQERELYERALREIRARYGEKDVRAVRPLLAIANSFREQGIPNPDGEDALNEALGLLRNIDDPSPLAIAEVLRDIGDWKTAFAQSRIGGDEYLRAWTLLGTVPNGGELRREWFLGTVPIYRGSLDYSGIDESGSQSGSVLIKFDIDESGRVTHAEVLESDPPGLMDDDMLDHVYRSRFRPHVRNGELVPGPNRAMRFTFPYTPDAELARASD